MEVDDVDAIKDGKKMEVDKMDAIEDGEEEDMSSDSGGNDKPQEEQEVLTGEKGWNGGKVTNGREIIDMCNAKLKQERDLERAWARETIKKISRIKETKEREKDLTIVSNNIRGGLWVNSGNKDQKNKKDKEEEEKEDASKLKEVWKCVCEEGIVVLIMLETKMKKGDQKE